MTPALPLEIVESALQVAGIALPAAPYELATSGFLTTLGKVEKQITTLKITDGASAQVAADLLVRLTSAGTALEKQREVLKAPFLSAGRAIDQAAKVPQGRIDIAKANIKMLQTAYDTEQRRLAAETEAKRQAEIRRLEIEAAKERAEADRKAKEIADRLQREAEEKAKATAATLQAAAIPEDAIDMGDDEPEPLPAPVVEKTASEVALEKIATAPVVAAPKVEGVRFKTTLVATVTDVALVPDSLVIRSANMAAITALYCKGWTEGSKLPVCAGVKFEEKREVMSTGRRGF